MNDVTERLEKARKRISEACASCGRDPRSVRLLAVSKKHPAERVRAFFEAGQRSFGENRVDEALAKQPQLADLDIQWHFIGHIQSNKTRDIAARFDWVQSVDRARILERLSRQRPSDLAPLQVCLQVNINREPQKSGAMPEDIAALAELAVSLPRIRLRGLMCLPRFDLGPGDLRASFAEVRELLARLDAPGARLDTLSMGMSADLEDAIAEGSTMLRVGTDLMGPRPGS